MKTVAPCKLDPQAIGLSAEAVLVKNSLIEHGLETPMVANHLSRDQKYAAILDSMTDVMYTLGLDLSDDSLSETPHRIAKMYVDEIFSGLDYQHFPKITAIDNKMKVDEMVAVKNISLTSTCEHHLITIDGLATVAYVPSKKVIGLSKINRVVDFFAKRPQVQERLTRQILVALQTLLDTEDVAVFISAAHYCVKARGVKDVTSTTSTRALGGVFRADSHMKADFLSQCAY